MAYIKGQPGHFFFEVRDMETGALFPGCTFSKNIVYVDGNTDINTSTSPSFNAWSTLNASLSECRISGSVSGLWRVSIPTLPSDCETLTFYFIPTSGLNVHVPLVTISLENAPAESVDISGLATSAELESARHELSSGISNSTREIGLIPYNVWNYALPSNISSSYVGGYLKNMYTSVNSIQQDIPSTSGISAAVWSETQRTLTSPVISDSVRLATKDNVADAREYIIDMCATASGFATPADVNSAKNEILANCATATGFATPADVKLTTTTEKVEVVSQTVDLSGMATLANQQEILANLAAVGTTANDISKDVSSVYSYVKEISEIPEAVWNYGTDFNARTVKANGVSLDGTDLSVQVDSAEIANAVWTRTVRTLTSGDNIDFPEFDTSVLGTLATSAEIQAIADGRKLTDLAVPADLVVNTTTETVEVISQTVDLSGIPASVWNYGKIADRVVTAGSVEISGDVHVDASSIAAAVWSSPERELTQDVASPADVNSAKTEILTKCRTATGFATPADVKLTTTTQTVDLTDLKNHGDKNWKTAEGFARSAELDPKINLLLALIKKWKVVGSRLTAYDDDGNELGSFTLTKNANGQIIEVS